MDIFLKGAAAVLILGGSAILAHSILGVVRGELRAFFVLIFALVSFLGFALIGIGSTDPACPVHYKAVSRTESPANYVVILVMNLLIGALFVSVGTGLLLGTLMLFHR